MRTYEGVNLWGLCGGVIVRVNVSVFMKWSVKSKRDAVVFTSGKGWLKQLHKLIKRWTRNHFDDIMIQMKKEKATVVTKKKRRNVSALTKKTRKKSMVKEKTYKVEK
jgi:hypothetical protein